MTNKRRVWSGGWVIAFTPSLKINGPMRNEWSAGQAIWFIATSYFILISNKQRIYQSLICTKKYLNRIQCRSRSCVDTYRIWSKSTKKRTWVKHNSRVDLFFFFSSSSPFSFPWHVLLFEWSLWWLSLWKHRWQLDLFGLTTTEWKIKNERMDHMKKPEAPLRRRLRWKTGRLSFMTESCY